MRWASIALIVSFAVASPAQSVEDWLSRYATATQESNQAARIEALRGMLDFRDERINRVYLDALFDPPVSNQAKWCLVRIGGPAFPEGWKKIESDPEGCAFTVFQVWAMCGPGGVREVVKGLAHKAPVVRREATRMFAAGSLAGPAARWVPLDEAAIGLRRAFDDGDSATQCYVLRSVTYFAQPERNVLLARAIKDASPDVRTLAAGLMYFSTDNERNDTLIVACDDAVPMVREAAAKNVDWDAARDLGLSMRVAAKLVAKLDDRDAKVRAAALATLCRWTDPRGWTGNEGYVPPPEQQESFDAVRSFLKQQRVADKAFKLLSDKEASLPAIRYLAFVRDERAFSRLVQGCGSKDYGVAWNSVVLLGFFGDPRALPVLKRLAEQSDYRTEALRSIARIEAAQVGGSD